MKAVNNITINLLNTLYSVIKIKEKKLQTFQIQIQLSTATVYIFRQQKYIKKTLSTIFRNYAKGSYLQPISHKNQTKNSIETLQHLQSRIFSKTDRIPFWFSTNTHIWFLSHVLLQAHSITVSFMFGTNGVQFLLIQFFTCRNAVIKC